MLEEQQQQLQPLINNQMHIPNFNNTSKNNNKTQIYSNQVSNKDFKENSQKQQQNNNNNNNNIVNNTNNNQFNTNASTIDDPFCYSLNIQTEENNTISNNNIDIEPLKNQQIQNIQKLFKFQDSATSVVILENIDEQFEEKQEEEKLNLLIIQNNLKQQQKQQQQIQQQQQQIFEQKEYKNEEEYVKNQNELQTEKENQQQYDDDFDEFLEENNKCNENEDFYTTQFILNNQQQLENTLKTISYWYKSKYLKPEQYQKLIQILSSIDKNQNNNILLNSFQISVQQINNSLILNQDFLEFEQSIIALFQLQQSQQEKIIELLSMEIEQDLDQNESLQKEQVKTQIEKSQQDLNQMKEKEINQINLYDQNSSQYNINNDEQQTQAIDKYILINKYTNENILSKQEISEKHIKEDVQGNELEFCQKIPADDIQIQQLKLVQHYINEMNKKILRSLKNQYIVKQQLEVNKQISEVKKQLKKEEEIQQDDPITQIMIAEKIKNSQLDKQQNIEESNVQYDNNKQIIVIENFENIQNLNNQDKQQSENHQEVESTNNNYKQISKNDESKFMISIPIFSSYNDSNFIETSLQNQNQDLANSSIKLSPFSQQLEYSDQNQQLQFIQQSNEGLNFQNKNNPYQGYVMIQKSLNSDQLLDKENAIINEQILINSPIFPNTNTNNNIFVNNNDSKSQNDEYEKISLTSSPTLNQRFLPSSIQFFDIGHNQNQQQQQQSQFKLCKQQALTLMSPLIKSDEDEDININKNSDHNYDIEEEHSNQLNEKENYEKKDEQNDNDVEEEEYLLILK